MIRFPPRRILVPADTTEPSLAALRAGRDLARRFRSSLSAVYVESLPPSLLGFSVEEGADAAGEIARQFREFRAWREARLRREAAGLPAGRLRVRTVRGRPERMAAALAGGRAADLIVMGTHGRKGLSRLAAGSVAEEVASRAKVPVLIVRPFRGPFRVRRVLCPVNLTPYSDEALRAAHLVARSFRARLTALLVRSAADDDGLARGRLLARLDAVLGRVAASRAGASVRAGDPRAEILAQSASCDLVVLSAHRKSFLGGWILGTTAERVLRCCAVPVLAVPSPARAKAGIVLY